MSENCLTAEEIKQGHDEGRYLWLIVLPRSPVSLEVWERRPFLKFFKVWRKLAYLEKGDPEWEILKGDIEEAGQRILAEQRRENRMRKGLRPDPPDPTQASER